MQLTLCKCQYNEIPEVIELLTALYIELGEEADCVHFLTPECVKEIMDSNTTEAYLIKDGNNTTLGIITLAESNAFFAGGRYGLLDEMYVKPRFRSLNIGSLIMDKIKNIAIERKWSRIDVTGPIDEKWSRTLAFYKKCGFEFTGPKLKLIIRR